MITQRQCTISHRDIIAAFKMGRRRRRRSFLALLVENPAKRDASPTRLIIVLIQPLIVSTCQPRMLLLRRTFYR
jgi:hypothetical protein